MKPLIEIDPWFILRELKDRSPYPKDIFPDNEEGDPPSAGRACRCGYEACLWELEKLLKEEAEDEILQKGSE